MAKRVDIKTGFKCNNNCYFCVQAHKKPFGNRPKVDIKKDIRDAKKAGCSELVFTGGEFTIRDDAVELIQYATNSGFSHIQLQSNHRMLSDINLCKEYIKAGVTEFGPAIHGHTAKLHDYLTRVPGSFNQTTQAIKNLKQLKQRVMTNSVVVKPNYRYVPQIAQMLVDLGVDQFQFAYVHAMGNALENFDKMMPWFSLAAPYIKKGLQIGLDNNKIVMAEAMPFCMLKGYEKYCAEWYIPNTEIRDIDSYDPCFQDTRKLKGKKKFPQCTMCIRFEDCEGPWREYPEKRGFFEFKPILR